METQTMPSLAESDPSKGAEASTSKSPEELPLGEARVLVETMKTWKQNRVEHAPAKPLPFRSIMDRVRGMPAATDEDRRRDQEATERRERAERDERAKVLMSRCGVAMPRYGSASFDDVEIPRQHLSAADFRKYQFTATRLRDAIDDPVTPPALLTQALIRQFHLPIAERTFWRWVSEGKFPRPDISMGGKSRFWKRETVEQWINSQAKGGAK